MTLDELKDVLVANRFGRYTTTPGGIFVTSNNFVSNLVSISVSGNTYILLAQTPRTREVLEILFSGEPNISVQFCNEKVK
jgi:hypothetical protein